MSANDPTINRRRQLDTLDAIADRRSRRGDGPGTFVGVVFDDGAMPDAVPSFFMVHPADAGGAEVEGGAGVLSASKDAVPVLVTDQVPVVGDNLIVRRVGARWAAERGCARAAVATLNLLVTGCPDLLSPFGLNYATLAGVTVTLTRGATTVSATTDSTGHAVFPLPSAGAWSWSVATTGYAGSGTLLVASGSSLQGINVPPDGVGGYFCDGCSTPVTSLVATVYCVVADPANGDIGVFGSATVRLDSTFKVPCTPWIGNGGFWLRVWLQAPAGLAAAGVTITGYTVSFWMGSGTPGPSDMGVAYSTYTPVSGPSPHVIPPSQCSPYTLVSAPAGGDDEISEVGGSASIIAIAFVH